MIKLTITEKGGEPRPLTFDKDEISIGRVQGNDIVLPKGNISKRHTKLAVESGKLTVFDLKSTNGTYVNGRKIAEPTAIRGGDKIFVGDFLIVIDPQAAALESSGPKAGSGLGRRPPPPPPPRPGSGAVRLAPAPSADLGQGEGELGDLGAFGGLGGFEARPPSNPRGRAAPAGPPPPPAPPPPPMRRTMVQNSLQDDSADIGSLDLGGGFGDLGAGPPSFADVSGGHDAGDSIDVGGVTGAGAGEPRVDLGVDMGDGGADLGADVFGSRRALDEDDRPRPGFAIPESVSRPRPLAAGGVDLATPPPMTLSPSGPRVEAPPIGVADSIAAPNPALESMLADPGVSAILVATTGAVDVERGGKLEPGTSLGDANGAAEAVWQLASTAQPPPASDNPIVDVRLGDGTRVTAFFPPVTASGVQAVIRKTTLPDMALSAVTSGSAAVEAILTACLASRRNLLLAGDRPAITALAAALLGAIPPERRVVGVGTGRSAAARSRLGWIDLAAAADPAALVRAAVAFRADHLACIDLGGGELPELLLAAARGQEGLIGTVAGRSAAEALERVRALSGTAAVAAALPALVASVVDLVVLAGTTAEGTTVIGEIAEVEVRSGALAPAFVARRPEGPRGAAPLDVAGVSQRLADSIAAGGGTVPPHLIRR